MSERVLHIDCSWPYDEDDEEAKRRANEAHDRVQKLAKRLGAGVFSEDAVRDDA